MTIKKKKSKEKKELTKSPNSYFFYLEELATASHPTQRRGKKKKNNKEIRSRLWSVYIVRYTQYGHIVTPHTPKRLGEERCDSKVGPL